MFTGLIQAVLEVRDVRKKGDSRVITLDLAPLEGEPALGESVALDGACLTVSALDGALASFDAVEETVSRTTLADLAPGSRVNVERALRAGDRLGGHFVTGHVDAVGTLRRKESRGVQTLFDIAAPRDFNADLVRKGSVAVAGISLTLVDVTDDSFTFVVIPHTIESTTLGTLEKGGRVNLESDVLGKYVRRYLGKDRGRGNITGDFLAEHGFM